MINMNTLTVSQQKPPAKLCKICRTIPFDGLILPYVSETKANPNDAATKASGFYDVGTERSMTKIKYESMGYILTNEDDCEFCDMLAGILRRHPTSPFGPRDQVIWGEVGRPYYSRLPGTIDRPCEVKVMWFVGISHPTHTQKGRWTARLFIAWKDDRGTQQGAYSCFQTLHQNIGKLQPANQTEDPFSHELLCGGRRRPLSINLDWIRRWIRICSVEHQEDCAAKVEVAIKNDTKIRLVDVKRMCIVDDVALTDVKAEWRYMALSYVWGEQYNPHRLTLRRANAGDLRQPGAFKVSDLSQTLADFVELAQLLDIPYVWIDALCILQDDREDKIIQIAVMSAIYQHSFVTVIAASGDSVESGLPGLRSGTRKKLPREITIDISSLDRTEKDGNCDYVTLIETLNHPEHTHWTALTSTIWNSRSWTYQERMLSKRALIFTKEQLYWTCNEASFCEEVCMEFPQQGKIRYLTGFVDAIETSFHSTFKESCLNPTVTHPATQTQVWKAYKNFVRHYSRRHLKYPGDISAAFDGMIQAISERSGDELIMGHPKSRFEHGLAWDHARSLKRRTDVSALPMTAKNTRVTFPSWSWMGWIGEVDFNVTLEKESDGFRSEIECFTHRTSPVRLSSVGAHGERNVALSLPDWIHVRDNSMTLEEIERHHPALTRSRLENIADETLIFFWADTAKLRVQNVDTTDYDLQGLANVNNARKPKILNSNGESIGELLQVERSIERDIEDAEFVVIERKTEPDPELARLFGNEVRLTVLQIGWRYGEQGRTGPCMERLNIGTISEKDWLRLDRQKRLIALQ